VSTFNEYLLGGVIGLTVFAIVLTVSLYVWPGRYLEIPEMEAVVRVAEEASFPVGESRVVTLGPDVVLVVRSGAAEYHALRGTSSLEGCILQWDPVSLRVVSPCKFLVYDLHGNVVRGLTTVPLHQYTVFVRQGTVYVTGS
jgi:nitrite reductase/ring-hydroxylating ferredoxin subunit